MSKFLVLGVSGECFHFYCVCMASSVSKLRLIPQTLFLSKIVADEFPGIKGVYRKRTVLDRTLSSSSSLKVNGESEICVSIFLNRPKGYKKIHAEFSCS